LFDVNTGGNLWTVYWGKHMRVDSFKALKDHQKVHTSNVLT